MIILGDKLGDNLVAKSGIIKYHCEKCNYECCKKYNWEKHLLTARHKNDYIGDKLGDNLVAKSGNKLQQEVFKCEFCDKEYHHRQNLWRHNKKCLSNNIEITKKLTELDKDELIITLLKQNAELIKGQQDMMIKLTENGNNNNTNSHNTHTNSHNKSFNLNFFLNETCKNAMNITDFVDSIKLQLSDLMQVGELGYVEGISKIIVKNLNNLDESVRPVHCTDKKRETMYIKDAGQWEKEDEKKSKLKKAVNKIADKNIRLLPAFREKYPDYGNSSSKTSDVYNKMVIEVMETDDEKKEKIIKKISNATILNK